MTKPEGPVDYLPCYNCGTCLTQRLLCYYLGVCAGALCVWGHGNASAYEGHFFHDSTALAGVSLLDLEISRSQSVGYTRFDMNPLDEWSASRRDRIEHIHKNKSSYS